MVAMRTEEQVLLAMAASTLMVVNYVLMGGPITR